MVKRKQFFSKIFVIYSLLLLFFFLILAGVFFFRNREILHAQAKAQRAIFTEQARDRIDLAIKIVNGIINQMRSNENVKSYARTSSDNYYDIVRIVDLLPSYLVAFPNSQITIDVFKPDTHLMITPIKTISIESYLDKKGFSEQQEIKAYDFIETSRLPNDYIVLTSSDDQVIEKGGRSFTMLRKLSFGGSYELVLFITFYEMYYIPELNTFTNDTFMIINNDEIITYSTSMQEASYIRLLDEYGREFISLNSDVSVPTIEAIYDGYFFNMVKSQSIDWQYIYISSNEFIQGRFKSLLLTSLGIMLILMALGIVIAYFTTKFVYKPVRSTLDSLKTYSNEDTYRDEFKYIIRTTDNIYQDLQNTIENSRISLKDKFLRDLLYGHTSEWDIDSSIDIYGLDGIAPTQLFVAIVEHTNYLELEDNYTRGSLLSITSQLLTILKKDIGEKFIWGSVELDGKKYAIIFKKTENELAKKILDDTISSIEEKFEIKLFASIGCFVDSIENLNRSFHEALNIIEYRHVLKTRSVIDINDIETSANEQYFYPMDFEASLINFAVSGNNSHVNTILKRILDENLIKRQLSKDTIIQFVFAIVATIKRILQKVNKLESEFFDKDSSLYLELEMYENKSQLADAIKKIFNDITYKISQEDELLNVSVSDQMKEYIMKNYTRDISLEDIATHFNLSRGYICSLFKNEIGRNFKEYLDRFRIERAKEIMLEKSIKIRELANKVGYNDTGTFIRIFKKYTGVSPGSYSENTRK